MEGSTDCFKGSTAWFRWKGALIASKEELIALDESKHCLA
jgi:hypothetical protein